MKLKITLIINGLDKNVVSFLTKTKNLSFFITKR